MGPKKAEGSQAQEWADEAFGDDFENADLIVYAH